MLIVRIITLSVDPVCDALWGVYALSAQPLDAPPQRLVVGNRLGQVDLEPRQHVRQGVASGVSKPYGDLGFTRFNGFLLFNRR